MAISKDPQQPINKIALDWWASLTPERRSDLFNFHANDKPVWQCVTNMSWIRSVWEMETDSGRKQ